MGFCMDNHGKKMIAPVVVVLILISYYFVGVYFLLGFNMPIIIKAMIFIISVLLTVVLIRVLAERIREIKQGEEDDLGKY
jgi:membrane protein implicated in regulation of membrane protease activity